jgi:hypothetical protein
LEQKGGLIIITSDAADYHHHHHHHHVISFIVRILRGLCCLVNNQQTAQTQMRPLQFGLEQLIKPVSEAPADIHLITYRRMRI